MSRIGKQPVVVPSSAKVKIEDGHLLAEGPKGKVRQRLHESVDVEMKDGQIEVTRRGESVQDRADHGLVRALINNAVVGVTEGFEKNLEIVGVGYKADLKGKEVHFSLGYSHPIVFPIPDGIEVEVDKNTKLVIRGADRQKVGQVAAEMRDLRRPDPYKAKGVRYADEQIRRKVGKAGAK